MIYTTVTSQVRDQLINLMRTLTAEGKQPKDHVIYTTDFARNLNLPQPVSNVAKAVYKLAKKFGFQTASPRESGIKVKSTPTSEQIRRYFQTLKSDSEDSIKISPRDVCRQLNLDPNRFSSVVRKVASEFSCSTNTASESLRQLRQTDEMKKMREHLQDLKLKNPDILIYPAAICRRLDLRVKHYATKVRKFAIEIGLKVASESQAKQAGHQTDASLKIWQYLLSLITADGEVPNLKIFSSSVVRTLGLDPRKHRQSLVNIAKGIGFETASKETAETKSIRNYLSSYKKSHPSAKVDVRVVARRLELNPQVYAPIIGRIANEEFGLKLVERYPIAKQIKNYFKQRLATENANEIIIRPRNLLYMLGLPRKTHYIQYIKKIALKLNCKVERDLAEYRKINPRAKTTHLRTDLRNGEIDTRTLSPWELLAGEEESKNLRAALEVLKSSSPISYFAISFQYGLLKPEEIDDEIMKELLMSEQKYNDYLETGLEILKNSISSF